MIEFDDVRTELVRARGFIRGAETQLTKTLAAFDALENDMSVLITVLREGQANAAPVQPVLAVTATYDTSVSLLAGPFAGQAGRQPRAGRIRITTAADTGFLTPVYTDTTTITSTESQEHVLTWISVGALSVSTNYIADFSIQDEADVWSPWSVAVAFTTTGAIASAALTGTATPSLTEAEVVTGSKTIILTLTNDTFIAAGTGPIGTTANSEALMSGIDSGQAEAAGWDAQVKASLVTNVATALVRTSATVATITIPAVAGYSVTADEAISITIPAAVLTSGVELAASSGLAVIASGGSTAVASDGFESGNLTGGTDIVWSNFTTAPKVTVQTSPARTGTYSMRLRYPAVGDLVDTWIEPRWAFTQINRQIWVEYYIYLPSNYQHRDQSDGTEHHKFFAMWGGTDPDYGNANRPKIVLELWRGADDDHSNLRCINNMNGQATSQQTSGANVAMIGTGGIVTLAAWTRVRVHGDTGTTSANNAALKVWINETVAFTQTGMTNTSNAKLYWTRGYLMGYTNGGFAAETDFHIDDLKVYDADPGW